jgi:hypothetical protein
MIVRNLKEKHALDSEISDLIEICFENNSNIYDGILISKHNGYEVKIFKHTLFKNELEFFIKKANKEFLYTFNVEYSNILRVFLTNIINSQYDYTEMNKELIKELNL